MALRPSAPSEPPPDRTIPPDGALSLIACQRGQEDVDRVALSAVGFGFAGAELPRLDGHDTVRGQDTNRTRFDPIPVPGRAYVHPGRPCKDFRQHADMLGIEMGDDHKCHRRFARHQPQQFLQRFQTAGRSTDAHDGKGPRGIHHHVAVNLCWGQRITFFTAYQPV